MGTVGRFVGTRWSTGRPGNGPLAGGGFEGADAGGGGAVRTASEVTRLTVGLDSATRREFGSAVKTWPARREDEGEKTRSGRRSGGADVGGADVVAPRALLAVGARCASEREGIPTVPLLAGGAGLQNYRAPSLPPGVPFMKKASLFSFALLGAFAAGLVAPACGLSSSTGNGGGGGGGGDGGAAADTGGGETATPASSARRRTTARCRPWAVPVCSARSSPARAAARRRSAASSTTRRGTTPSTMSSSTSRTPRRAPSRPAPPAIRAARSTPASPSPRPSPTRPGTSRSRTRRPARQSRSSFRSANGESRTTSRASPRARTPPSRRS